jgi:uncharacterized protein YbcC (UPF0753/DUF2309 family)
MGFQKVEYSLPHEQEEDDDLEIESSSAIEIDLSGKTKPRKVAEKTDSEVDIEVIDDTPKEDRNRRPSTPPEEVTDEELGEYSEKVRKRIQHFSKGYHDERRAKEQAHRERQELESFARTLVEENNKLKGDVGKNRAELLEQAKKNSAIEVLTAKTSIQASV